jgi:uncharacterized protein (TIGR03435 family)
MSKYASVLLTLAAAALCAQAPIAFEVATVMPAAPVTGHMQYHMTMKVDAGRASFINASMLDLIRTAYSLKPDQVAGPDWLASEKFDVEARLPEGALPSLVPQMLQALLSTRFHLETHVENREISALALVESKGGVKLAQAAADGPNGWTRTMTPEGMMRIDARKITLPALADLVGSFLNTSVRDATGLSGTYDLAMDFSPEDLRTGSIAVGVAGAETVASDGSNSAIFASLQRLGLKLERRKMQIGVRIIDRLEKAPTEN